MEFYDMVQRLQLMYGMKIILISCGSFYISIGADAILLNKKLGLKLNCAKKCVCKVGVPKNSIDKYIEKIDGLGYSYIILDYDKETNKLIKISEKHGKCIEETAFNNECEKCDRRRYIDRIVHRWLVDNFLEPAFVPTFINTSFACIKGRGMHRAALYVQKCMKSALNKCEGYYILKMDIAKYFDSIDKNILFEILKRKIKDEKLLWLIKEILFSQKREKGLEIGNYTSQMLGNIYLNEQDQFVKHKLHIKYYARYLDDSVIIVKTKQEAKIALKEITRFLEENLKLKLNNKTQIFKGKQGANFCGYKINEYRMKLRDKGKRKLKKKIKKLTNKIYNGEITSIDARMYLAGHMGYIKYADVKKPQQQQSEQYQR